MVFFQFVYDDLDDDLKHHTSKGPSIFDTPCPDLVMHVLNQFCALVVELLSAIRCRAFSNLNVHHV